MSLNDYGQVVMITISYIVVRKQVYSCTYMQHFWCFFKTIATYIAS